MMLSRRTLLGAGVSSAAMALSAAPGLASDGGKTYAVAFSDADWRMRLNPAQYAVLRQEGTERPFSSPLLHEKRRGIFSCAGCRLDAFSSTTKFESGTGWPSFWDVLPRAVEVARDRSLGMVRTAISCSRCGGHLGHVFEDGPKPTGLRYCMNGVALGFRPTAA